MTHEAFLRSSFVALEANGDFSEAVLVMRDGSRLSFCHRVGERWAKAEGPGASAGDGLLAGATLATMVTFRLNAKHLEIRFADGSRWEARFPGRSAKPGPPPPGLS
jgi:hypothetical protein